MTELVPHPLANILPDMTAEEYEGLKASIRAHGQELPIVLLNGQILDGRHRYRACCDLGIEPITTEIVTDDPLGLVFTLNLQRRHLNPGQIAMLVAKVTERRNVGRPDGSAEISRSGIFRSAVAAEKATGIYHGRISEAIAVLEFDEECGGSLAGQVEHGERALSDAHRYVSQERQRLKARTKAHAKVEALSKPSPVPPPYKPAHPPASDDVPLVEDTRDAGLAALAEVDRNPAAEAFREWAEQHDPIELRKASWASSVSTATGSIQDLWRRLEGMAKDKRADDWDTLPEEQEFIDALREVARDASKRFHSRSTAVVTPITLGG
jgi:ParB-like nuclease domain